MRPTPSKIDMSPSKSAAGRKHGVVLESSLDSNSPHFSGSKSSCAKFV